MEAKALNLHALSPLDTPPSAKEYCQVEKLVLQ